MFVTILVSAVGATTALAAKDARLQGKFDVTLTVTSSNVLALGERVERTYKFTPLRRKGACGAVRLGREAGLGLLHHTSKLKRIGRGVCESTEQNLNLACADGSEVSNGTGHVHIEIDRKKNGQATRIGGTLGIDGCVHGHEPAGARTPLPGTALARFVCVNACA
jgi:hypothetical protein